MAAEPVHPTFRDACRVWLKIGLLSFGGPAGQIALMHRELVERRQWVSDRRFLHALNYCMLLPGPEAQQLAIYIGWLLHKTRGGIAAGALFVLPGALLMLAISAGYVFFGMLPWVQAIFDGLGPAVMAIVAAAVFRIGRKTLRHPVLWAIAAASFAAIFFAGAPFPLIILCALATGLVFGPKHPQIFDAMGAHAPAGKGAPVLSDAVSSNIPAPTAAGSLSRAALWLTVWLAPPGICIALLGPGHILSQEGMFFSKAALVTFGGAYAVLPYVAQQAVEVHGWLLPTQMIDGLALAETTPGPLILVLQFVGFLGGWNASGAANPLLLATLAAALTTWVTFTPGCLFIFVGAPFIERTRGSLRLNTALSAVTAAVVGVVLNLAVWFAWHIVVPAPGQFRWLPLVLACAYLFLIQKLQWEIARIIGLGALVGLAVFAFHSIASQ